MNDFHYTYILESTTDPSRHYTGLTEDPTDRLRRHNTGQVPHTAKHGPWRYRVVIAFPTRDQAVAFETYLKSHSGRAFAKKHF